MSLHPSESYNTPGLNIGVDLNRDNFICWNSLTTDKLNKVQTWIDPLNYSTWKYTNILGGTTLSTEAYNSLYGTQRFTVITDATDSSGINIGKDTVPSYNFTGLVNGTVYTVQCWMMRPGGVGSKPIRMQIRTNNDGGTKLNVDASLSTGNTWVEFRGSFTANGTDSNLNLRIFKNQIGMGALTWHIAGLSIYAEASSVASQGYNTGDTTDLYENISERVKRVSTFIGMRPYEKIGDENTATLECYNRDQFFSQEYTSSPAYGTLLPYTKVQVRYGTDYYYTGYIETCKAKPFKYGERTATITCFGLKRYLESATADLDYAASQRTDQYLTQMLTAFDSTIDTTYIQVGQTTLAYFGDNAYDDEVLNLSVYDVCKQIALLEQGWFFINADGVPEFFDRYESAGVVSSYTVDNDAQDLEYASFGEFLINRVTIKTYPRKISGVTTDLLWALDAPQTVAPGNTRRFRVPYTDTNSKRCGATDVATPAGADYVTSGGAPGLDIHKYGQFARIAIDNLAGFDTCTITTLNVRGRAITYLNPIEVKAENTTSITNYGLRELSFDMKGLSNVNEGDDVANFIILLRSQLRGDVKSVTLVAHQDSANADLQRGLKIGEAMTVIDDQLSHNQDYFIVGVAHDYSEDGMLTSKYNLEAVAADVFWILGTSALDTTTVLGY